MSDWSAPCTHIEIQRRTDQDILQAVCGNCRERVAIRSHSCWACGGTYTAFVTPFERDREEVEAMTDVPYKRVAWG